MDGRVFVLTSDVGPLPFLRRFFAVVRNVDIRYGPSDQISLHWLASHFTWRNFES